MTLLHIKTRSDQGCGDKKTMLSPRRSSGHDMLSEVKAGRGLKASWGFGGVIWVKIKGVPGARIGCRRGTVLSWGASSSKKGTDGQQVLCWPLVKSLWCSRRLLNPHALSRLLCPKSAESTTGGSPTSLYLWAISLGNIVFVTIYQQVSKSVKYDSVRPRSVAQIIRYTPEINTYRVTRHRLRRKVT
ncbi:hypothetical protein J6590_054445 [Homalodisca vitripennis]|nr:hypothetical protein J6590_054445 [Homalodisca vitripennis]